MQVPVTHTYKTVGDCRIQADVYRPRAGTGAAAAVVYVHGGALIFGSRQGIHRRQLELYLEAGYAVVAIDYRLAPQSKLPQIIEDLRDALRWVAHAGPGLGSLDPKRIAVVGHSAGGYLALMAGFCVDPRPRAIVSFYGYGDIVGDWYGKPDPYYCSQPLVTEEESRRATGGPEHSETLDSAGQEKFYRYCRQRGLWPREVGGRDPRQDPSFFGPYCPLRNVSGDYPPTLLLHGDRDTDVPYEQSVLMAEALARHGVEHELITIPGGGHAFDNPMDDPTAGDAFGRVLRFLERHVG